MWRAGASASVDVCAGLVLFVLLCAYDLDLGGLVVQVLRTCPLLRDSLCFLYYIVARLLILTASLASAFRFRLV